MKSVAPTGRAVRDGSGGGAPSRRPTRRYREFYGFDPNDPRHYDLVIDTHDKSPELVRDFVLVERGKRGM